MPSDLDGDKLERAMAAALRENTVKVEGIVGQVEAKLEQAYERTAQLLRGYREDVSRTTMGIHARLLSYEDELTRDSVARERRQKEIDAQYGELRNELTEIKHNQRFLVRLAVIGGILALGIVIGWLVL